MLIPRRVKHRKQHHPKRAGKSKGGTTVAFGDGWDTDPCDPVIKDDRMYGRGSSDDGYAFFTALLSI